MGKIAEAFKDIEAFVDRSGVDAASYNIRQAKRALMRTAMERDASNTRQAMIYEYFRPSHET